MNKRQAEQESATAGDDVMAATLKVLNGAATVGELRGLSPKHLEALYAMGYNFYNQAQYTDAEKVFGFLCFYNHLDRRFWKGLAAARHMQKNPEGAVQAYAMMALLDIDDPEAPLHAADCYLAMGRREEAISALSAAARFAAAKPQYAKEHDRAATLLRQLEAPPAGES